MTSFPPQSGPCVICGDTNYGLSCGGPTICPKCDCGNFDIATVMKQQNVIAGLREQLASVSQPEVQIDDVAKTIWLAGFKRAFDRTPSDPWENQSETTKDDHRDTARKLVDAGFICAAQAPIDRLERAERALAIISYMCCQCGEDAMKMRAIATDVTLWDRPDSMWWYGKDYGPSVPSAHCEGGK